MNRFYFLKTIGFLLFLVGLSPGLAVGADKVDECLTKTIQHLGIDPQMMTDPAVMNDLYRNRFYLEGSPNEEIFKKLITQSLPIKPVLDQIRRAIVEKHPAVGEFLCAAVNEGLLPEVTPEGQRIILQTVHHILILDVLVNEMVNDAKYAVDIDAHYRKVRGRFGISEVSFASEMRVFLATGSLFEVAKQTSVDIAFEQNLKLREKTSIEAIDVVKKTESLRLNIGEALATDLVHGFMDNAKVGFLLAEKPVRAIRIDGPNRAIKQYFEAGWAPLYETWNLAFITGNLNDLNLLFPKLLIPTVIGAADEDYLFRRVMALWLSINVYVLDRLKNDPTIELPNARELARRWGEINLKYVFKLKSDR